jgi:predicted transcriptional regulator YdeE
MNSKIIEKFSVIGIAVRTTNENQQAATDIPKLWSQFMSEGMQMKIPHKVDDTLYCIYTDYEKDFTKPYTTLLGCKVTSTDVVPEGMVAKTFELGNYTKFEAKGNILQGMVFNTWSKIWATDLPRAYQADFEIYGEKAANPEEAEVDIFISVK